MKNTNLCPKCKCNNIIKTRAVETAYGNQNSIMPGFSTLTSYPVTRYVCSQCGYSEEWVEQEDLQKLKQGGSTFFFGGFTC